MGECCRHEACTACGFFAERDCLERFINFRCSVQEICTIMGYLMTMPLPVRVLSKEERPHEEKC
jgi:hypothetical protein